MVSRRLPVVAGALRELRPDVLLFQEAVVTDEHDHCTRLFTTPVDGVWGSDHFGVLADLSVVPIGDE